MKPLDTPPQYLNEWAQKIKRIGLATPAILALETHKPLSFILSQMLLVGQPMLDFFLPRHFSNNAVQLFSNRQQLEQFIDALEEK